VLVGGEVVDHGVQLHARVGLGDLAEEPEELLVAVPGQAGLLNAFGRDPERGEQRVVPSGT
jgi:hypothetical protein